MFSFIFTSLVLIFIIFTLIRVENLRRQLKGKMRKVLEENDNIIGDNTKLRKDNALLKEELRRNENKEG